jgi:hypothetical protein
MHRFMLVAVVLYIFLAEKLAKPSGGLQTSIALSFGIVAIVDVMIAFGFRVKRLNPAIESLRQNPQDAQALFRWLKTHIVIMVLLVSLGLYGLALRFLGASFLVALPFYLVSVSLLLLWAPRGIGGASDDAGSNSIGN